ncbi:MAG: hypothetical protein HY394_02880 [Candidatus Diapherotrites archaeon]|nr:hypothetical protein [Candidatus Diapherotrites archaeon]
MATWLDSLKESYVLLLTTHPRSNVKLVPPHSWIRNRLQELLPKDFVCYSLDNDASKSKEKKINGKFYEKTVDVAIFRKAVPVGAVSFKFVASNYSQNSNNYFENLIGECFNVQSEGIPFCHVFVVRDKIPYYNKDRVVTKYEILTEHNLDKYLRLASAESNDAVPSKLAITIIKISGDEVSGDIIHPIDFQTLSNSKKEAIKGNISVDFSDFKIYQKDIKEKLELLNINKILKEFVEIVVSKNKQ